MTNEATISREIKSENWDILSVIQQSSLTKMGFKPVKAKKSSPRAPSTRKALPTLQEYYVVAHIKCELCGHLAKEAWRMVQTNYNSTQGEPYLRAVKVTLEEAEEAKAKRELHARPYCVICKERLKQFTQEQLIDICLKKAKQCACGWAGRDRKSVV